MIAQNTDPTFKRDSPGGSLSLMSLPDEIIIAILSFLNLESLLTAKLVCKHFDTLADQFVYENPKILVGRHAVQLCHALSRSPLRPNWIRTLLVSTKFGEDSGLSRLPPRLSEMRNLEDLTLETPDCNSRSPEERTQWIKLQDEYESIFERSSLLVPAATERTLPRLKKCTLHFVDLNVELYSLTSYASIFLHPNLKSLTLSCASTDMPDRLSEALGNSKHLERSTDLEHLFLEECDVHAPSLSYLLTFPRALKSLRFSEGTRYDGIFRSGSRRMHGNVRPDHLMNALTESCSDSLESLSLNLGHRRPQSMSITDPGQYLNMTGMTKLKFIELDHNTLALVKSRPLCDHKTWLRLPQSLETLKVSSIRLGVYLDHEPRRLPHIPLEGCLIMNKDGHGVPNLANVIYAYEYSDNDDEYNEMDDFLLLGNNTNLWPQNLGLDRLRFLHQALLDHAENGDEGLNFDDEDDAHPNILHLPIHPPQPPAANNYLPAHVTTNLNAVNPGNLNQAQQYLRQNWFTHANRARQQHQRQQREFTHLELSKIDLLNILNHEQLSHFRQAGIRLTVDMVKLPRGYIPPYLYLEDKPTVYSGFWSSDEAKETEVYKREFRLAREARIFERNLQEERSRRRADEGAESLRRRAEPQNRAMRLARVMGPEWLGLAMEDESDGATYFRDDDDDGSDEEEDGDDDDYVGESDDIDDDDDSDEDEDEDMGQDQEIVRESMLNVLVNSANNMAEVNALPDTRLRHGSYQGTMQVDLSDSDSNSDLESEPDHHNHHHHHNISNNNHHEEEDNITTISNATNTTNHPPSHSNSSNHATIGDASDHYTNDRDDDIDEEDDDEDDGNRYQDARAQWHVGGT